MIKEYPTAIINLESDQKERSSSLLSTTIKIGKLFHTCILGKELNSFFGWLKNENKDIKIKFIFNAV